jgi:peptidoglycan/xylan/chitin deacetylase (PgdA/CDA1 family)
VIVDLASIPWSLLSLPRRLLDRITNKREFLARAFGSLGFIGLLEQIAVRRPALVVLTYHRIAVPGNASNPYYDPVISATPDAFETHIRFLSTQFHILSLEALLEITAAKAMSAKVSPDAGKPIALVTFDDGYRDNCETALPILRKLGVPATFFIPTGFLNAARLPWWDHVACVLKRTRVPRLTLERWPGDVDPIVINLEPTSLGQQRTVAITTVVRSFLDGAIKDEPWFLAQLGEQAEVPIDSRSLGCKLFMGLDQVRQLANAGMAVGSHGQSHRALASLDDAAQRHELTESKRFLENSLGRDIKALAYPFGWGGTFTARTVQLAIEAGYYLAFSSLEGVNRPGTAAFQPFTLRRLNVGTGDSPSLLRARAVFHAAFGKSFL